MGGWKGWGVKRFKTCDAQGQFSILKNKCKVQEGVQFKFW